MMSSVAACSASHVTGTSRGTGGAVRVSGSCRTIRRIPSANRRLDLDARDELRHAVEHVVLAQQRVAERLDLGVAAPVARRLADLVGDQRDRLGLAQQQAAGAPPPRELTGEEQLEAVLLTWQQAHGASLPLPGGPTEALEGVTVTVDEVSVVPAGPW